MKFRVFKKFSNEQRLGIFILIGLIVLLQIGIFFNVHKVFFQSNGSNQFENEWKIVQNQIDSLKQNQPEKTYKPYPFNPNFITDYKGYQLGMTTEELDRLFEFRKQGQFVNSAEDFQKVTQISDSLLSKMSPFFKFPDWVTNQKNGKSNFKPFSKSNQPKLIAKDFNLATKEDFIAIKGIGEGISTRIIKERDLLGGFLSLDQIDFIWGLSPEVIAELKQNFFIKDISMVKKIKINDWSVKEISAHPFFSYAQAKEIVIYRSMNEKISNIEDLAKIKQFPVEKIKIIALYLEF